MAAEPDHDADEGLPDLARAQDAHLFVLEGVGMMVIDQSPACVGVDGWRLPG